MRTATIATANNFNKMMTIETAANRLLLRMVIAFLIRSNPGGASEAVASFSSSIDQMAGTVVVPKDLDGDVHAAALALVRRRASNFLAEFGFPGQCAARDAPSGQPAASH